MKPKTRLFLSIGDVVLLGAFVCFAALKLPSLATFLLLFGSFLYLLVTFAVFFKRETALSGVRALCWVVAILWFEHETVTFLHQGALAKLSFLAAGGMTGMTSRIIHSGLLPEALRASMTSSLLMILTFF